MPMTQMEKARILGACLKAEEEINRCLKESVTHPSQEAEYLRHAILAGAKGFRAIADAMKVED